MNGEPQALLDEYKDLVKTWVLKVREVLDKDFTAELKRLGIPGSGTVSYTHLDVYKRQNFRRLGTSLAMRPRVNGNS